jgi:hypothetical protein
MVHYDIHKQINIYQEIFPAPYMFYICFKVEITDP